MTHKITGKIEVKCNKFVNIKNVFPKSALTFVLAVAIVLILPISAVKTVIAIGTDPGRPDIDDFHVFAIVSRLVWERRLADSYHAVTMMALERAWGGRDVFMPYSYPPLFSLVLAPLALLPIGPAFLLFTGTTLFLFLIVLRFLAGAWFWTVLLATAPAVLINLRLGQNGFLTASLAGASVLLTLRRRGTEAGLAAGLLAALKPHLALSLPILFLLRRDLRALCISGATAAVLTAAAAEIFGLGTSAAFVEGLSETRRFMELGMFPLHRMVSIYACLLSFGAPVIVALAVHCVVAVGVLAVGAAVSLRIPDQRAAAGVPLMATIFISPYFYDYDLTVFGAGLALVLPALVCALSTRSLNLLLVTIAIADGIGLMAAPYVNQSIGGPVALVCFGVMMAALLQSARTMLQVVDAI